MKIKILLLALMVAALWPAHAEAQQPLPTPSPVTWPYQFAFTGNDAQIVGGIGSPITGNYRHTVNFTGERLTGITVAITASSDGGVTFGSPTCTRASDSATSCSTTRPGGDSFTFSGTYNRILITVTGWTGTNANMTAFYAGNSAVAGSSSSGGGTITCATATGVLYGSTADCDTAAFNFTAATDTLALTGVLTVAGTSNVTGNEIVSNSISVTSTAASTSIFANALTGFTGRLLDMRLAYTSVFNVAYNGQTGIGVASPTDYVDIQAGTLATTIQALNVTGTLSSTDASQAGIYSEITGSGSGGTGSRTGLFSQLLAGATGSANTYGLLAQNNSVGTGTGFLNDGSVNAAIRGFANGTGTGDAVGTSSAASNDTGRSIGGAFYGKGAGSLSVGVAGIVSAGTLKIGVLAALGTGPSVATSAALIADNSGSNTLQIARFVSGGNLVTQIAATGTMLTTADISFSGTSGIVYIASPAAGVPLVNMAGSAGLGASVIYFGGSSLSGYGTALSKPYMLLESPNTTAGVWSNSGTILGMNWISGYAGNFIDFQRAGATLFSVASSGVKTALGVPLGIGGAPGNNTLSVTSGALASAASMVVGTASLSNTAIFQKGVSFTVTGGPTTTSAAGVYLNAQPTYGWNLFVDGGTTRLNGRLYLTNMAVASGTPGTVCYDTTTFEIATNNALTCTVSDEEQKTKLASIDVGGLDTLMKLRPSQYEFLQDRKKPELGGNGRVRLGFGAQSLQAADPRLADGYDEFNIARAPDEYAILAITVKAVQELSERVKALEGKR